MEDQLDQVNPGEPLGYRQATIRSALQGSMNRGGPYKRSSTIEMDALIKASLLPQLLLLPHYKQPHAASLSNAKLL